MTVKKLKEMLARVPDDYKVVVDKGYPEDGATTENEIVDAWSIMTPEGEVETIVLQTREDFDVEEKLEEYFSDRATIGEDECDAMAELFELGYTLDDFSYSESRYEWAKRVAKEYGLV